jgi:DNA-binding NtrC family response regulator
VKQGKFREDLFYRLNVVPILMPPLRERKEDIPLLAKSFLVEFSNQNNKKVQEFEPQAMEALIAYNWPGNVRELRAAIEGAVVLGRKDRVTLRDLPASIRNYATGVGTTAITASTATMSVEEAEKQLIIRALQECKGNRTEAALKLGMSRRTLHRKLHKYHLEGF